jgi:hypothetical protein
MSSFILFYVVVATWNSDTIETWIPFKVQNLSNKIPRITVLFSTIMIREIVGIALIVNAASVFIVGFFRVKDPLTMTTLAVITMQTMSLNMMLTRIAVLTPAIHYCTTTFQYNKYIYNTLPHKFCFSLSSLRHVHHKLCFNGRYASTVNFKNFRMYQFR